MNIVKQFDDFEFFDKVYEGPNDPQKDRWTWGLGDDGELYFQSSDESRPYFWFPLKNNSSKARWLSLRTMKKIVKEFGQWLVFM